VEAPWRDAAGEPPQPARRSSVSPTRTRPDSSAAWRPVLERIRQRLRQDAVNGQVDAGPERPGLALDTKLHVKAGTAYLLHERRKLRYPRLGRQSLLRVGPGHLEEARELCEGLPTVRSIDTSCSRTRAGSPSSTASPASACSTISETACATTSWRSRAMRARSASSARSPPASRFLAQDPGVVFDDRYFVPGFFDARDSHV